MKEAKDGWMDIVQDCACRMEQVLEFHYLRERAREGGGGTVNSGQGGSRENTERKER